MIRILRPWFENLKKRQVKTPKVYIRDSGLLHTLLDVDEENLSLNPKSGASWEGFALEEIAKAEGADSESCYFWSTSNEAELDLLLTKGQEKLGFEFKYTDMPRATKSMHIAMEASKLDHLTVIVPVEVDFPLHENIRAVGLKTYLGLA
jgi:predicted AAA+ superfamily ATPase